MSGTMVQTPISNQKYSLCQSCHLSRKVFTSVKNEQILIYSLGAIGPFMFIPAFIVTGAIFASCAYFIPKNEETTREMLVDYLQNNKLY